MTDVLILPTVPASLVFGLDWLPLISGRAGRVAYRTARHYRASHLVVAGDTAASVGLATLKQNRLQRKQAIHSAAQNVARLCSTGTIALLLQLEAGCYWLVAVHEGAVIARTDKLYGSDAEAQLVLAELKQAYAQLLVLGSVNAPAALSLSAIAAASDTHSMLVPVGRWRASLPMPMQWAVLALVLALLVPRLWLYLKPKATTALAISAHEAASIWQETLDKAGRSVILHGVNGTRLLLQSLYELPVHISGWALLTASCTVAQQQWNCLANYERRDTRANNENLLAQARPHWSFDFVSIDQAQLSWQLKTAGQPLSAQSVKSSAYNERYLSSSFQAIRNAFTQMQLGKPQVLTVEPPRDPNGQLVPMPAGQPIYAHRSLLIQGPLRSVSLLLPYTESIRWQKVSLSLNKLGQASLKNSRINVSFQGELYEVQSMPNHASKAGSQEHKPASIAPDAISAPDVRFGSS